MHPMERLRHVARSGGADPAVIVAETVDALTSLCPAPSELVPLCRNLVERNPTCGPLWWLCAQLLAKPEAIDAAWTWAEQIERDGTPARLAECLPDEAAVMTVGYSGDHGSGAAPLRQRVGAGSDGRRRRRPARSGDGSSRRRRRAGGARSDAGRHALAPISSCSRPMPARPTSSSRRSGAALPPSPRRRRTCRCGSSPDGGRRLPGVVRRRHRPRDGRRPRDVLHDAT